MNAALLLRHFTIRLRMLGAIAMVLGMLGLLGAVGGFGGLRIQGLQEAFSARTLKDVQTLGSARAHLAQVRLLEKQMVIEYEDGAAVTKLRQAWTAEVEATRGALSALPPAEGASADAAAAQQALAHLQAYAERSAPVLGNIAAGGYDTARVADRMLGKAKEEMVLVEQGMEALGKAVALNAEATQEAFRGTMKQLLWVFAATLALAVLVVGPLTLLNSVSITGPIGYARHVAQAIAGGDLTQPIRHEGRDEASELLQALDRMQHNLRDLVGQVHASSQSIQQASAEVASGNSDLSSRTEQAAGSLQQTASSMEQLTGTVRHSADSARQASELAASAAGVAQRGGTVVAQVVTTMEDINASSRRIADIIGTIDGIAFQTNILALNAAVEAARAANRAAALPSSPVRCAAWRSAARRRRARSRA